MPTTSRRAADATEKGPERTVRLRGICAPMPPKRFGAPTAIELAMQYLEELRLGVEREDGSMQFECEVRVKWNPKYGHPNSLGPWAHGSAEARHLDLNWEGAEDQVRAQFGRMKIHLAAITWEQIEQDSAICSRSPVLCVSGKETVLRKMKQPIWEHRRVGLTERRSQMFEVLGSAWEEELRVAWHRIDHSATFMQEAHHYLILCRESPVEVVAWGFTWGVVTDSQG
jgi:Family of unknown function (DUF5990)